MLSVTALVTNGRRRVPGLRREEVAVLAGVSTDYYARLERASSGSSTACWTRSPRLRLDEAETARLHDLTARPIQRPSRPGVAPAQQRIRPSVQRVLDGMADMPAIVMNGRLDLLATSKLGAALYSPVYDDPARPANLARFCFLDPQARALYPHWDEAANTTVPILRTEAGRHPYDRDLSDLIGELSTRSDTFGTRWANHNVRLHRTGAKVYHHPVVGRPTVEFEVMDPSVDGGLALTAFTAADAASRDGLKLPASWAATLVQDDQSREAQPASQETLAAQAFVDKGVRRSASRAYLRPAAHAPT